MALERTALSMSCPAATGSHTSQLHVKKEFSPHSQYGSECTLFLKERPSSLLHLLLEEEGEEEPACLLGIVDRIRKYRFIPFRSLNPPTAIIDLPFWVLHVGGKSVRHRSIQLMLLCPERYQIRHQKHWYGHSFTQALMGDLVAEEKYLI